MRKWILPEHIDDILPAEAERIEALRRTLLDHFRGQGYRLVQPPLVEHLESLLTGTGRDLELQTFKVVDPLSGRLLGFRADMTPQVARIDAHVLNEPGVTRLCYAGSVLRTLPAGIGETREVVQIGAELYGEPGIAGDCEVITLLLSSLAAVGLRALHLDLGHVGVYRALANAAGIAGNGDDSELFAALRAKDMSAVGDLTAKLPGGLAGCPHGAADALRAGAGGARRRTRAAARHRRRSPTRSTRWRASRRPRRRTSTRCMSTSRTSPATITTPARSSPSSRPARRTRSATAAATTASARRSAARGRQPVSRSTCASSPASSRAPADARRRRAGLHRGTSEHGQERRRHRDPVGR